MKLLNAAVVLVFLPSLMAGAEEASKSKVEQAQILLTEVGKALDLYYTDCAEYPLDLKYLTIRSPNCAQWGPDPYIKNVDVDPWGHDLKYIRRDPQNYELRSNGADGVEGGEGENTDLVH